MESSGDFLTGQIFDGIRLKYLMDIGLAIVLKFRVNVLRERNPKSIPIRAH
jgi:hypothetical protein